MLPNLTKPDSRPRGNNIPPYYDETAGLIPTVQDSLSSFNKANYQRTIWKKSGEKWKI